MSSISVLASTGGSNSILRGIRYEAKILQQACLQPSDTCPCRLLEQGRATQARPLLDANLPKCLYRRHSALPFCAARRLHSGLLTALLPGARHTPLVAPWRLHSARAPAAWRSARPGCLAAGAPVFSRSAPTSGTWTLETMHTHAGNTYYVRIIHVER